MILARLHGIHVEEIQPEKDGANGYIGPKSLHWDEIITRHETAIVRAIDTLETISDWLGGPWTYGNLAIICALDYASYRAPHLAWPDRARKLSAWHEGFRNEAAYKQTYEYP